MFNTPNWLGNFNSRPTSGKAVGSGFGGINQFSTFPSRLVCLWRKSVGVLCQSHHHCTGPRAPNEVSSDNIE
jgi:hypothetical protein